MIRRVLLGIAVLTVIWFAVQGGQFGSWDLWKQWNQKKELRQEIDSLQRRVDSLRRYRARLDTDSPFREASEKRMFGFFSAN